MEPDAITALAADAYVYGSPLVHAAVRRPGLPPGGLRDDARRAVQRLRPRGRAYHARYVHPVRPRRPRRRARPARPLRGPVGLHVPDTGGAYYVLQFVDAWGNTFAYLGTRATGTGEGDWLVVPPGWAGTVPDVVSGVIDAPTSVVSVLGRLVCDGPDDMPRVRALQQELTLTHLGDRAHRTGLPATEPGVPGELRFFEELRVWMADFPPAAADRAYQDRFQPLGLLEEGLSPYVSASPRLVRALGRGLALGRLRVEEAARLPQVLAEGPPGAWQATPHLRDHNLDHFGVGTLGTPEWTLPDRESSYLVRAVAARRGYRQPHGYEAVFAHTSRDSRGRMLDGAHRYALRFAQPPPVRAFWSLTAYDSPGGHLVTNAADRYAIGDRTPGLVHGDDGSLTLHLSAERPHGQRGRGELAAAAARRLPARAAAPPSRPGGSRRELRRPGARTARGPAGRGDPGPVDPGPSDPGM